MELLIPACMAFVATTLFVFALRPLAGRMQLVDVPGGRKQHAGDVPLIGGIAMLLGILIGSAAIGGSLEQMRYLLIPAALLVAVGALDDRLGLSVQVRFLTQFAAALIMVLESGYFLADIGDPFGLGVIELGRMAIPISVIITLTVINAWNFIDGIDGLAASMALVALLGVGISAGGLGGGTTMAMIAVGAIAGFILFNLPLLKGRSMRVFMGDAGSTMLGFLIVALTVTVTRAPDGAVSPVVALWFALVPLADFFSVFCRRLMRGRSPFHPSREHFHHVLMRAGLTPGQTLAVLVGFALAYASFGIVGGYLQLADSAMFLPWIALLIGQSVLVRGVATCVRLVRYRGHLRRLAAADEPAFAAAPGGSEIIAAPGGAVWRAVNVGIDGQAQAFGGSSQYLVVDGVSDEPESANTAAVASAADRLDAADDEFPGSGEYPELKAG